MSYRLLSLKIEMTQQPLLIVFDRQQALTQTLHSAADGMGLSWNIQRYGDLDEALSLLDNNTTPLRTADLILVDASLPNMQAFDFLYCVKRHPLYKHVPLIVLGQDNDSDQRFICYHFNGNAYWKAPTCFKEALELTRAINDFWLKQPTLNSIEQA